MLRVWDAGVAYRSITEMDCGVGTDRQIERDRERKREREREKDL